MTTQTTNQQSSAVGALVLAGIGFFVPGIKILAIIALVNFKGDGTGAKRIKNSN